MSFFVLLLLLLSIAAGWVLGRRYDRVKETRKSAERAKRYFKGLGYVLSDQPDKAIDAFVELLNIDSETVETHFALGALYRKRGETERAIRIHQAIVARPMLPASNRSHASYELGMDYFAAGLLDRAETIFLEMQHDDLYRRSCLRELLALYQLTQEWDKAAHIAEALRAEGVADATPALAHFYCQLAESLHAQDKTTDAEEKLQLALTLDNKCVRASLLQAKFAAQNKDLPRIILALQRIIRQDVALFSEALPLLQQLPVDAREPLLQESLQKGAGASVVLALADILRERDGERPSAEFLIAQLQLRPSLRELQSLVELHRQNAQGSTRTQLDLLQDVLQRLIARLPTYRCGNCGFSGRQLHWRCPGCRRWNSVRPVSGVEGE